MSVKLPTIDLTSAVVGTTDKINLANASISADPSIIAKPYHILLINESGCGLALTFDTGQTDFIAAGAWRVFTLQPGAAAIKYLVEYVLPQAAVFSLIAIVYGPNENVDAGVLGNSPVNVGNSVTANVNSINNDGNPDATLFIEAKVGAGASSVLVYNNGAALWGNVSWDKLGNCTFIAAAIQPTAIKWSLLAAKVIPLAGLADGALPAGVNLTGAQVTSAVANANNVPASGVAAGTLGASVVLSDMVNSAGKTIAVLDSAGGGVAGVKEWVGTTDPGGAAAEGDIWLKG